MAEYGAKYENTEATQCAEDKFWQISFEYDYGTVPGKDEIEALNTVTTFYDKTYMYAQKKGFQEEKDAVDSLIKFIFNLVCDLRKDKSEPPLISLKTVRNWLKEAPPASASRDKVYMLCFALGLNAEATGEFFLKAYLERPFNYKNINEAVYFFCMKNRLTYADAERIIAKIEMIPYVKNSDSEDNTEQIGDDISNIAIEEDFIKYILDNRSKFDSENYNKTATKRINELVEDCKKCAKKLESKSRRQKEEDIKIENIDELLTVITGYYARETMNGKKLYKKSISQSKLPKKVRENFPQREQFKQIDDGKASFDTIRKALIMLKFYSFFASALLRDKPIPQGLFDEFVTESNAVLAECGYVQLYWQNPYDWIFGYCACADNPLDEFLDIIDVFYLDNLDIYNEEAKK